MRVSWLLLSTGLLLAGVAAAACNALNGSSDLVTEGSGAGSSATLDGGGTGPDGGPSSGGDGGGSSLPRCGSSLVCVSVPDGWTPIALLSQSDRSCQPEYPDAVTLFGAPKNSNACRCSCAPVGGACNQLTVSSGASCSGTPANLSLPPDGSCGAIAPFDMSQSIRVNVDGGAPTSCTSSVIEDLRPPTPTKFCAGAAPIASAGCGSGEVCVPEASGSADNCIVHDGDVACPPRFSSRQVLGTDPKDTRACSACTCATDGCATTEVVFAPNTTCFLAVAKGKANGTCSPVVLGGGMMKSAQVISPGGCTMTTPSAMTGDVALSAPKTVCCRSSSGGD